VGVSVRMVVGFGFSVGMNNPNTTCAPLRFLTSYSNRRLHRCNQSTQRCRNRPQRCRRSRIRIPASSWSTRGTCVCPSRSTAPEPTSENLGYINAIRGQAQSSQETLNIYFRSSRSTMGRWVARLLEDFTMARPRRQNGRRWSQTRSQNSVRSFKRRWQI